jgi:PAS domain S-box-containing protein
LQSDIIAQRRGEEKTLRSNRILRTMVEGSHALVRATTEDELFQNMCRVLVETGGYRMAWVGQVEHDEEKSIRPLAHAGHEAGYLALAKLSWGDNPYGRGPSGSSVRTGATQFSNDIAVTPVMTHWNKLALERGYLSSIALPLRDKTGVFGALTIYAGEPHAFGPEEVALLEQLADDISYGATALRTRRANDEIEQTLRLVDEHRQVEEALRRSEERYRLLVEQAVDGIFLSDASGRYVDVNSAGCKMLGYTRDEIISRTIGDLIAPEEVSRLAIEINMLIEGQTTRTEWRFRRKDGSEIVGEVVGRQLPDGYLLGILRDVTERKQMEESLRESEERLKRALAAAHAGFWEDRLDTGEFMASDQALALYGLPPGTKIDHELAMAVTYAEDRPRAISAIDNALLSGVPFDLELRSQHPDGSIHWIHSRADLRTDGGIRRLVGLVQDITERKKAEEALRKSEQRLRRIYESGLMGFVTWKMSGEIVDANDKFLEMVGYDRADLAAGRINWKQMTPLEFTSLDSFLELKATAANSVPFEKEYFRKDGSRVPVLAARALFDEARGDGVAMIIDITARKQAEKALMLAKLEADSANLAKSKFLASASHDLRQPVQSLTLLLSAIERHVKDKPKAAHMVSMANASMASLNGMLTGILDISRLDAGVITPEIASVDIGDLIGRLAREYAPRAAEVGLVLRHVPRVVLARTDVALLERILRNLIENALRYTAKGGVLIGARPRGGNVRIDVIDTGIGIPAHQQKEIFEEFRQLNNPARDSNKGLGLGLAIVSRLARLIGAEIEVDSRVDHGARFSLLLPLENFAPAPVRVAPAVEDAGGRILIIEDNAGIRQAYEIMLGDWGYETLSAASGEEALDRAAQEKWRFDAIIADHRLGAGLTGSDAATEIARRAGRSFPTMLVTGDTGKERLAEVASSGFALLHKPVDADDLRRTLASVLRGNDRPPASDSEKA